MEDEAPAEFVEVFLGEAHFGADYFAVCADSFDVASGESVVFVEGGDEGDCFAGCFALIVGEGRDGFFELFGSASAQRGAESRGGVVGEDQRQRQQRGERNKPLGDEREGAGDYE